MNSQISSFEDLYGTYWNFTEDGIIKNKFNLNDSRKTQMSYKTVVL